MNIDWNLFWQIAGIVLTVVVPIALFIWTRREKVKIHVVNIEYKVHGVEKKVTVYLASELQWSGWREARYIRQVLLKPEEQTYKKLGGYFALPTTGVIEFNGRKKLTKDIVPWPVDYPSYYARSEKRTTEDRDAAQRIASELSKKPHKIGLVWEDTGKTTWRTITPEVYNRWV